VIGAACACVSKPVRDARRVAGREYRLVVEGELSDRLETAFAGMTLTREEGNTVLVGPVRDQAELQGLLRRVSDFGLTLLSASVVEGGEEARSPRATGAKTSPSSPGAP
jgi:hypothetical protein